ncbi:kinase-like protein [Wolfiporia cocos MD-104 SS10]|uniref:Kinase-like protein n=1 Tax=Wolfiporia cocos (strain MD-104) TaxID=742152 RepID=A0A2H3J3R2_WOLCO|nr:kinase-like protein [Wolfiporia cocos MD-104 SS10]
MGKLTTKFHSASTFYHRFLTLVRPTRLSSLATQNEMSPTLGPDLAPSPSLAPYNRPVLSSNRSSTSSLHSGSDNVTGSSPAYSTSSVSIPFDDGDVDVVKVEGLRHSNVRLEARRFKTAPFMGQLLDILRTIRAPSWTNPAITADAVSIQKVSGSMTNAVFFVSCPSVPSTSILLLRIYGPSSGSLISRPRELQTLHVLSSRYRIGPRVYGTFENGRVEEYFDATTLTAADLRDEKVSAWIGARMAELHGVDIKAVEPTVSEDIDWMIAVTRNIQSWLGYAREVLALPTAPDAVSRGLDLDLFAQEWERYMDWVRGQERHDGVSRRVFAHNDTQYGNLLRLKSLRPGMPEHRQIIVVDFEYAALNPAALDIANHFHEWTANYHDDAPHVLRPALYPSPEQRRNFYSSYLRHLAPGVSSANSHMDLDQEMAKLEREVQAWSPASHAMWTVWGIVQAREIVEGKDKDPEFDYLGYAQCRMDSFRREIRALGIGCTP